MMHDTYERECDVCGARAKAQYVTDIPKGWHKLTLPVPRCQEWAENCGDIEDKYDVCPDCCEALTAATRGVFNARAGKGIEEGAG